MPTRKQALVPKPAAPLPATPALSRLPEALDRAIYLWAEARTDRSSARYHDLIYDKTKALTEFFIFVGKAPAAVSPADVQAWQHVLEGRGLAEATVYALISRVSSFYAWARQDKRLAREITGNPVQLARPQAPHAYQSKSVKALADPEVTRLLQVVQAQAATGDLAACRDYALLRLYFATGMRREEVAGLTWGDLELAEPDGLKLTSRVKGGARITREVDDPGVRAALLAYLERSGRFQAIRPTSPLWIRHDRACKGEVSVTSHGIAKSLKHYAAAAGLTDFHIHQTRHTYARMVADESGSLVETQDALGHKNLATTLVYVQRVGVKRDKHSRNIARRLKLTPDK